MKYSVERPNLVPYANGLALGISNFVQECGMCPTQTLEAIVTQLETTYDIVKVACRCPDIKFQKYRVFDADRRKTVLWAKSFSEARDWILDPNHGNGYFTLDVIGIDGEVEEWYNKESLQEGM